MAKREQREQARTLRQAGHSLGDIAKQLKVAKSSISVWVRDIGLTDEQLQAFKDEQHLRLVSQNKGAKANRERALKERMALQEMGRERARKSPSKLFVMGCLLYWTEGAKDRTQLDFVNSDANMIRIFGQFLRQEFEVPDERFTLIIQCYTDDIAEQTTMKQFWLLLLHLPQDCAVRFVLKHNDSQRYRQLNNGICTIRIFKSREIVQQIFGAIQEYVGFDNPDWLG
jgi:predicted DNA-binding protein YlxM (UPF0122 family)